MLHGENALCCDAHYAAGIAATNSYGGRQNLKVDTRRSQKRSRMFTKRFFTSGGLTRFQENMSRNLCHVSVNSEAACWVTLSAALSGTEDAALDHLLLLGVENLYDNPAEFDGKQSGVSALPVEFKGLRDIFFTYFIRRLPVMLRGTTLSWSRAKSPAKQEIVDICDHCIQSYAQHFQATSSDFTSRWREGYRRDFGWTRWWVSISRRDEYYYDLEIVESFLHDSLEAMLELRYPEFLRLKSQNMQGEYGKQFERWKHYHAWLRVNRHVFIDKLADHLQLAYPIYSTDIWSAQPERSGDASRPRT